MSDTIDYFAVEADVPKGTLPGLFFDSIDRLGGHAAYQPLTGSAAESWSYDRVAEVVTRGAAALAQLGVQRGDRVAVLSENRLEWALADWICLCAGAVDVPIYSTVTAPQVGYILKDSGSTVLFASTAEQLSKAKEAAQGLGQNVTMVVFDADAAEGDVLGWDRFLATGEGADGEGIRRAALQASPEDLATLIYTSGTTGTPKGVMLTQNNLASNVWASRQVLESDVGDSTLSFLPLSHVLQRMVDYLFFSSGCTITHGSINDVAEDLKRVRPTKVVSVPRLYEKVYQKVLDAGGLKGKLVSWAADVGRQASLVRERGGAVSGALAWKHKVADALVFKKIRRGVGGRLVYFVSGGAALAPEINRFFHGAGITILEGYGLTETSPVTNVNTIQHFRIGTVGRPVPGTEVRIAPDGEILIRGPQVMRGYYRMEEQTREVLTDEGWFSTGDIGELSADGYLTITDRKKDLIKTSGGKYVAPQAIENRLKSNPFLDQAVVVGEGRNFCSVLVVPAFERLRMWAAESGIAEEDPRRLLENSRCQEFLAEQVFEELKDLASFETPKKIGLLHEPFTIENGALTPTQKVRRSVVVERHSEMIDDFYSPDSIDRTIFLPAL